MQFGKCLRVKEIEPMCYHWVRTDYGSDPRLLKNVNIKKYLEDEDLVTKHQDIYDHCCQASEKKLGGCGNPYNYMTEEERQIIIKEKKNMPESNFPGHDPKSVYTNIYNGKDLDYTIDFVRNAVGSDCWCVYQRKIKNNEPIKTFFDSRELEYDDHEESERVQEEKIRNEIIEDPSIVLPMTSDTILCIVMGGELFIDNYITLENGKYNIIDIHYPR